MLNDETERFWSVRSRDRMVKPVLVASFDLKSVIMENQVSDGVTVKTTLLQKGSQKCREKKKNTSDLGKWFPPSPGRRSDTHSISVKQCSALKHITVLNHPISSPDLVPCDLFLFPEIKSCSWGNSFWVSEEKNDSEKTNRWRPAALFWSAKEQNAATWSYRRRKC